MSDGPPRRITSHASAHQNARLFTAVETVAENGHFIGRGQVGSMTRASYHGPRLKGKWTFLFPASASIQPGTRRWSSRIVRLIGQGCLSSTRFVRNPGPVTVSMRSLFLWFCCRGWGDREIRLIAVILDRSSILRS